MLLSLPQSYLFMTTVVDGVLLPKSPEEILAEKKHNMVPYMVGINQQEFGWIIPMVRMCRPLESFHLLTLPLLVAGAFSFSDPTLESRAVASDCRS